MSDTIYRQQAIDAVNLAYTNTEVINNRPVNEYERELYFRIRGELSKLPSAQPERRTGKWKVLYPNHKYKYHCSECGAYHRAMYDFCPSCGARMDGESDA